jgi:PAS domain S-box-containing protein
MIQVATTGGFVPGAPSRHDNQPTVEIANSSALGAATTAEALLAATRLVAASADRDLDAVLDAVAEQARRLLGADAAALQLADPATGELIVRRPSPFAAAGTPLATPGTRYRPGAFTREAVRRAAPVFASDFQRDARHDPARRAEFGAVVASMVVPLLAAPAGRPSGGPAARPELVGTLYLDWTRPYAAGPDDLAVADAFGQEAAVAIRIARALEAERAARLAAAASDARFRQLAESVGAVFYVRAVDFSRFDYVSPAYRAIWGRDPDEVTADPGAWLAAVHPDDRERVASAPSEGFEAEYRVVQPDGTERWVHDRAYPMRDPLSGEARTAGIAADVTDRRQAEEALRAAIVEQARLDGAIKTARSVAHLINNELVMLVGYAELLPRLSPNQTDAAFQSIARAASAVADLVDRLQRIVRFEETDIGGGPMLDLTAAASDDDTRPE